MVSAQLAFEFPWRRAMGNSKTTTHSLFFFYPKSSIYSSKSTLKELRSFSQRGLGGSPPEGGAGLQSARVSLSICVFRRIVGTHSGASWALISLPRGHLERLMLE